MTDAQEVNELKELIHDVCRRLEALSKRGIRIEFHINTDDATSKATLTHFNALQKMKLTQ